MKKRKIKLFASLTSLVMVVAVMAVGIWAASQQSLSLTTNVDFTVNDVKGTIAVSYANYTTDGEGAAEMVAESEVLVDVNGEEATGTTAEFDASTTQTTFAGNIDTTFTQNAAEIYDKVIKITITNGYAPGTGSHAMSVDTTGFKLGTGNVNVGFVVAMGDEYATAVEVPAASITDGVFVIGNNIAADDSLTIWVTLSVLNTEIDAGTGDMTFGLILNNV